MPDFSKRIIYLSEDQRRELFANDSITVDGVTITYDPNDIYVTPQSEPVQDVQVNGATIVNEKVANIPVADESVFGVIKIGLGHELYQGSIRNKLATVSDARGGTQYWRTITPQVEHAAAFYGLAKAAGADMKDSDNAVGTYTEAAKTAILAMIGAYAKPDGGIPAGDLADEYVKPTDFATAHKGGVVIVGNAGGLYLNPNTGVLQVAYAASSLIKAGVNNYQAITPGFQHQSVFYGLAKAAGTDIASSSNPVGTYTAEAKSAIRSMLGISDADIIAIVENGLPSAEEVSF